MGKLIENFGYKKTTRGPSSKLFAETHFETGLGLNPDTFDFMW